MKQFHPSTPIAFFLSNTYNSGMHGRNFMSVLDTLENINNLTSVEKDVVLYILNHKDHIIDLNLSDLAQFTYTSNGTIIRLCRKLGMNGYKDFKIQFIKDLERRRKEKRNIDMSIPFEEQQSSEDIMKTMAELSKEAVDTCLETLSAAALEQAASYMLQARIIYLYATGDSLISTMAFANRLTKLNIHTVVASQYGETLTNTYNITKDDVALFVSYSGRNIADKRIMDVLHHCGCKKILITSLSDISGYDCLIAFPNKESYHGKIATYYSQISINYILNCIFTMMFSKNYQNNISYMKNESI